MRETPGYCKAVNLFYVRIWIHDCWSRQDPWITAEYHNVKDVNQLELITDHRVG